MTDWTRIATLDDIPPLGARVVRHGELRIAVFRTADDAIFALEDHCPHKGGPLSQGLVCGGTVTCPLHGWKIGLESGIAEAPDVGQARGIPARVEGGEVFLRLPAA